jgi:ribosomal protein S18 acetylase RimI-like enzyme
MGHQGRYGKYGEIKRKNRLTRTRKGPPFFVGRGVRPPANGPSSKKSDEKKTPVRIRPARPADFRFIVRISESVFRIYGPYEKIIGSWLESGMTMTLVALRKRRPAGFVMISHFSPQAKLKQVAEILAIAVAPEKQRMGIGELLLKEVEKKAAEMNITELFLHTAEENLAAKNLFAKNKYVSWGISENFYPAGQNALIMSKKI